MTSMNDGSHEKIGHLDCELIELSKEYKDDYFLTVIPIFFS